MAFQLSPGVNVSEIDLTTVIPSVATSTGAFVGPFAWGPCGEVTNMSDEVRLVDSFGKPNSDNYEYWFSAANFLAYGNNLKVVRATPNGGLNATANGTGLLIKNENDWTENHSGYADGAYGGWAARWAGALGNSLSVSVADLGTYETWPYRSQFTANTGTSSYVSSRGGANDEIHIVVVDEDGLWSGAAGTVLEKYSFVSKAADAKDDSGNSNYYKDVINRKSKYVWWVAHPATANLSSGTSWGSVANASSFKTTTANVAYSLSAGADGTVGSSQITSGWDLFKNSEAVDISLCVTGTGNSTIAGYVIDNIAESRKDCVAFISPEKADCVDNAGNETTDIVAFRNDLNRSSSYVVLDSGYKYQYDKYNDVYRWIPLNGDIAGLCVRTDNERDPWFSPGGMNRGVIKNVIKLAWNPTKSERDTLYQKGVNPVVSFPGEGTVLFGDKTMLAKPSAFDRINVRRLFIVLEKAISRAARFSLFEFNDQFTRAQFVSLVEPYLRDVQGRRGITDYRVVCDETNNTGEVIDRNEFVGDIYIKPARSINFIQLNFVAVRTGVSFNEVVGAA